MEIQDIKEIKIEQGELMNILVKYLKDLDIKCSARDIELHLNHEDKVIALITLIENSKVDNEDIEVRCKKDITLKEISIKKAIIDYLKDLDNIREEEIEFKIIPGIKRKLEVFIRTEK